MNIEKTNLAFVEEAYNADTDDPAFSNASEFKKKAKSARSSESLPTGLLCNQYNPECDGKSAIRIRAKVRGYLKQKTIVNL
jgi:hypothetical protein